MDIDLKLTAEIESSKKVVAELAAIERILAKREGEIALGDLIQQEGRRELREVMAKDIGELESEEGHQLAIIDTAEKRMRQLESKDRRKEVNGFYKEKMRIFLNVLDVHSVQDKAIEKVDGTIRDTGSELPRALLASQVAFFHVIKKFGSAAVGPLMIDSPNQQDQDDKHLERILRFIKEQRPPNTQLILGLVDTPGVDFGGTEIKLEKKYSLLLESEFADVGAEIQHFIDAALVG